MPAIASLEDLKAAQKEALGYLRYAPCSLLYAVRRWRNIGWKNVCGAPMGKGRAIQRLGGGDFPRLTSGQADQELVAFCCRGKLWLEERTPEQLKGEGE
jgi:hypothetical protein